MSSPVRILFAVLTLAAVFAGATLPCVPASAARASAATAHADAGPILTAPCPCGCKLRPDASGVPLAPGWALLPAVQIWAPTFASAPLPDAVPVLPDAPSDVLDPVPLFA